MIPEMYQRYGRGIRNEGRTSKVTTRTQIGGAADVSKSRDVIPHIRKSQGLRGLGGTTMVVPGTMKSRGIGIKARILFVRFLFFVVNSPRYFRL